MNLKDKFCDLVIAIVAVALGGLIAFHVGWKIYAKSEKEEFNQSVLALRNEMSENYTILLPLIEKETWSETHIGFSYPSTDVATHFLRETSHIYQKKYAKMFTVTVFYRLSIEEVKRFMELMAAEYVRLGQRLPKRNLEELDQFCVRAIGNIKALKTVLDEYVKKEGLEVPTEPEFEKYYEYMKFIDDKILEAQKEIKRPQK